VVVLLLHQTRARCACIAYAGKSAAKMETPPATKLGGLIPHGQNSSATDVCLG
jgi:hypothetical protein